MQSNSNSKTIRNRVLVMTQVGQSNKTYNGTPLKERKVRFDKTMFCRR